MFTGIIEELGIVKNIIKGAASMKLMISARKVLGGTVIGDSIAVNGVCLTVTEIGDGTFTADVMHETYNRTAYAKLKRGDSVNLERAMRADGRFGGHIVSGHIDGTGKVIDIRKDDNAVWYTVDTSAQVAGYIVEKGSITIDGISLTVADVRNTHFSVSIIPHTQKETTLSFRKKGDLVNLENDCVGKYVAKFLQNGIPDSPGVKAEENYSGSSRNSIADQGITKEFLLKNGF